MMKTLARILLGVSMGWAGVAHFLRLDEFRAQVPDWLPYEEAIIYVSGVVEIGFAAGLLLAPRRLRPMIGWLLAGFFVVIFPGNISQFLSQEPAFGLDSNSARAIRLAFQPVLVIWALWCTGAWGERRSAHPSNPPTRPL